MEDYNQESPYAQPPQKKNNTLLIILIIVAVLLLCCCLITVVLVILTRSGTFDDFLALGNLLNSTSALL